MLEWQVRIATRRMSAQLDSDSPSSSANHLTLLYRSFVVLPNKSLQRTREDHSQNITQGPPPDNEAGPADRIHKDK